MLASLLQCDMYSSSHWGQMCLEQYGAAVLIMLAILEPLGANVLTEPLGANVLVACACASLCDLSPWHVLCSDGGRRQRERADQLELEEVKRRVSRSSGLWWSTFHRRQALPAVHVAELRSECNHQWPPWDRVSSLYRMAAGHPREPRRQVRLNLHWCLDRGWLRSGTLEPRRVHREAQDGSSASGRV